MNYLVRPIKHALNHPLSSFDGVFSGSHTDIHERISWADLSTALKFYLSTPFNQTTIMKNSMLTFIHLINTFN